MPHLGYNLIAIFSRTSGRCFHCGSGLIFAAHAATKGELGAWAVVSANTEEGENDATRLVPTCQVCHREPSLSQ